MNETIIISNFVAYGPPSPPPHIISYMVVNATRLAVVAIAKVMFGGDKSRSSTTTVQARVLLQKEPLLKELL
jgi:hypothetical protein